MNKELARRLDSLERNLEDKIESSLALINDRLSKQDDRIITLEKKVVELDSSARFSNELIETQKKLIDNLLKADTARQREINKLESNTTQLHHIIDNVKMSSNQSAQYQRSALNVIIGNVPLADGVTAQKEDSLALVTTIARNGGFTDFSADEIDVAHRLPARKGTPSIIVRFRSKAARSNFFAQRKNLKDKSVEQLLQAEGTVVAEGNNRRDQNDDKNSKIYITESLTSFNGELLRQAKEIAKPLGYQFFGYTVNGEVRVKKGENSSYIAIKKLSDLENIV